MLAVLTSFTINITFSSDADVCWLSLAALEEIRLWRVSQHCQVSLCHLFGKKKKNSLSESLYLTRIAMSPT